MWFLYEFLLFIGLAFYLPKALWRKRLPHAGWSMRLGRYPQSILAQLRGRPTIWIHAVSVGEVIAAQPLLSELAVVKPEYALVVSTVTPAGFATATRLLGSRATIMYGPLDFGVIVRRAFKLLHPTVLILVESELWPVLIEQAKRAGIPAIVVNGRVSARAFGRYRLVKALLRPMLNTVRLFLMQSDVDATRIKAMGAPADRVQTMGSLKWDASLSMRPRPEQCRELASQLHMQSDEQILVAGSTHRGEEDAVLDALQALRTQHPRARLILAPRHVERLSEVEALIIRRGLRSQRTSKIASHEWDVALVDSFGMLPMYYGLASLVFIGGSLIPHGGQNPLEAASLGKPIVFGPSMQNFADIAQRLLDQQAAIQVRDHTELIDAVGRLMAQPTQASAMGKRAQDLVERSSGVARHTAQLLQPYL